MTTEIGRVKCWISTEGLRQKEVLGRETGMVYVVKTTTATTTAVYILRQRAKDGAKTQVTQDKEAKDKDEPEPRKAFSAAPTFEEFLKFKQAERGETELKIP